MKYDIRRYWQALQYWYIYQYNKVTAAPSSPLLNDLVAYWKLDETSGTRFDSTANNNHLTDINTVGSNLGKIGNAADFVASNSEYLSGASNPSLQLDGDWTIAVWARPDDVIDFPYVLGKDNNIDRNYALRFVSGSVDAAVGTTNGFERLTWPSPVTAFNWYFIVVWHIGSTNTLHLSVNDGTPVSRALSAPNPVGNAPLLLGARADLIAGSLYDGRVDEAGIWKRLLTPAERTLLYNSGSGLTFPFV